MVFKACQYDIYYTQYSFDIHRVIVISLSRIGIIFRASFDRFPSTKIKSF